MEILKTIGDKHLIQQTHDDGLISVKVMDIKEYESLRYRYLLI